MDAKYDNLHLYELLTRSTVKKLRERIWAAHHMYQILRCIAGLRGVRRVHGLDEGYCPIW
jgi:hypothetical protein